MPISVVHVITGLDVGGAEVMLAKLVGQSNREAFAHRVISLKRPGSVGEHIQNLGIQVDSASMDSGVSSLYSIPHLVSTIRRAQPEVIQTWMYHANLIGAILRPSIRAPLIWNIRATYSGSLGRKTGLVVDACARLSRCPAAVITNSQAAQQQHEQLGYSPRMWEVIPNGFDTATFRPDPEARASLLQELGLGTDALLIGMIARLHPQKDHKSFLIAARELATQLPRAHFVLVGNDLTPENAEMRSLVAGEDLAGRVSLLGKRSDIPRLTAALDIATLTSAFGESFPNVIGEAMACGVPCVVTNVGDSALIVADTGNVVRAGSPSEIANGWRQMASLTSERRAQLGEKARKRIVEFYSLDSVVERYEDLYSRLAVRA